MEREVDQNSVARLKPRDVNGFKIGIDNVFVGRKQYIVQIDSLYRHDVVKRCEKYRGRIADNIAYSRSRVKKIYRLVYLAGIV